MHSIKNILVALDLGPKGEFLTTGSRRALELALDAAPALDAQVTLLHSSAEDEYWEQNEDGHIYVADGISDEGVDQLEKAADSFRSKGLETELLIVEEQPWIAIIRHVIERDIDLVIVGKRSNQTEATASLGSVTTKLIRKCPCLIWAVRPGTAHSPRSILASTDLGEFGTHVLSVADELRDVWDAELHAFHAFQLSMEDHLDPASDSSQEIVDIAETKMMEIREQLSEGSKAKIHTALTSPTRGILGCVERFDPDVVVMGTVTKSGIPGLLLGRTAERLLRSLDCSLLVVKPKGFESPVQFS